MKYGTHAAKRKEGEEEGGATGDSVSAPENAGLEKPWATVGARKEHLLDLIFESQNVSPYLGQPSFLLCTLAPPPSFHLYYLPRGPPRRPHVKGAKKDTSLGTEEAVVPREDNLAVRSNEDTRRGRLVFLALNSTVQQ